MEWSPTERRVNHNKDHEIQLCLGAMPLPQHMLNAQGGNRPDAGRQSHSHSREAKFQARMQWSQQPCQQPRTVCAGDRVAIMSLSHSQGTRRSVCEVLFAARALLRAMKQAPGKAFRPVRWTASCCPGNADRRLSSIEVLQDIARWQ